MPGKKRSGFERIFEVRLYPTDRQVARFNEMLWICGTLWNAGLSEYASEYRRFKRFGIRQNYVSNWPTYKSQIRQLNVLVKEHAWIREPVYYETLLAVLKQLETSMKKFIGQKKLGKKVGFPRFKPAVSYNTFTVYHAMKSITFSEDKTRFNLKSMKKLGGIKYRSGKKRIPDVVANVKITRRSGKWYAYFQHEVDRDVRLQELEERNAKVRNNRSKSTNVLGADIGVTQFLATSDGKIYGNPHFQKKYETKVANLQREMSRLRGAKNSKPTIVYKLVRAAFAKLSSKIVRCRRDWHHKLSRKLVDTHTLFALEDLQLRNMTKSAKGTIEEPGSMVAQKAGLNRSILDVAPGQFREFLKSKAFDAGGQVILVNPKFTSQTCSKCDHVDKKSRVARGWFVCTQCGFEIDADVNASRNQRQRGLAVLRPSIRAA